MDASTLSSSEERELAMLRRRAYGPDADIDSDPGALARLEQLETAVHPVVLAPLFGTAAPGNPDPFATPLARSVDNPGLGFDAASLDVVDEPAPAESEDTSPRRPWFRRIPAWGWFGAAAVAIVVATVVWGVDRLTEPQADVMLGRVSTDDPRPAGLAARFSVSMYHLQLENLQQYETHRTLRPWSATNGEGARCLFVQAPQFDSGIIDSCVPRGLDPVIDLPVWPGLPKDIGAGLPQGSVVRFLLHGDRVYVWEREGPGVPG